MGWISTVFDKVDREVVGPDVHPDRDNSPGRVRQGNPDCAGLAHGARLTSGPSDDTEPRWPLRSLGDVCGHCAAWVWISSNGTWQNKIPFTPLSAALLTARGALNPTV